MKFIDSQRHTINLTPDSLRLKWSIKKEMVGLSQAKENEYKDDAVNLSSTPITLNNSPKTGHL